MPIKVPDNDLKFGNSMVCDGKYDPTGTCKLMFSKAAQSCIIFVFFYYIFQKKTQKHFNIKGMNFTRSSASFPTFDCSTSKLKIVINYII